MTRSTPERRRLARLTGAMLLVLPLLASAAVLPDAPQQAFFSQPEASAPPPAPDASPLAPEALPPAPEAPEEVEMPPPPPAASYLSADTLVQYISTHDVRDENGVLSIQLRLRPDATYEIAEAIADYYSDGDVEGSLVVFGQGIRIRRASLREGVVPPPPPPPPSAPEAPEPPPPPPPPPPTPSDADLARYADVLSAELDQAREIYTELRESGLTSNTEEYIRAKTRLDTILHESQRLIQEQERRRLDALKREALGGDYH